MHRTLAIIRTLGLVAAAPILFQAPTPSLHAQQTDLTKLLAAGKLSEAAQSLQQELQQPNANSSQINFRLGVVQVFQAIEELGRTQYQYGLMNTSRLSIPLLRLPLPPNPSPDQLTVEKFRTLIRNFLNGINAAEATLAKVKPSSDKLTLDLASIRIDLNADNTATPEESVLEIINTLMRNRQDQDDKYSLQISFDDGDVLWLRGYCHVMAAFCEILLAHDWTDLFERSAHLFFPGAKTPYLFLLQEQSRDPGFSLQNAADLIAFIHCIHFEVIDREGMLRALQHLEQVTDLSRDSWELINAETDNDREWLPNPRQTAALSTQLQITPQMQSQWNLFLDEVDSILRGETLVPFWRGVPDTNLLSPNPTFNPKLGINVRKIFTEPQTFDLVLWLQGTGVNSFLETGPITKPERWNQITSAFRGQFMVFALWIN